MSVVSLSLQTPSFVLWSVATAEKSGLRSEIDPCLDPVPSRGTGSAAWSSAGAGSPAMPARRRKPQTMALFDAVQRRAGLVDFKQPLQPPRRGYSDDIYIVGAGRYLALR